MHDLHIGLRMLRKTLGIAASGIVAGLGGAVAAGPLIRWLLYGISPQDPASLETAAVFAIVVAAAAATAIPTAGAMQIDPADALRKEGRGILPMRLRKGCRGSVSPNATYEELAMGASQLGS